MENRGGRYNRQMPDKQKDLKGGASIVTSSVTGKRNAARKLTTLRMEHSELETDNNEHETAFSITKKWCDRFMGTQAIPPNTGTRDREMVPSTVRSHTKYKRKTKHAIKDAR